MVEDVIAKGVNGIAISCNDPTALIDVINKAVDAGIPVMCLMLIHPRARGSLIWGVSNYDSWQSSSRDID